MKTKPKACLSVSIEHKFDDSPDTSHLGKFSDKIAGGYYLDRKTGELKDNSDQTVAEVWTNYKRNQYEYIVGFQHSSTPEKQIREWAHVTNQGVNEAYLNCRYRLNRKHQNKQGNLFAKYKVKDWDAAATREDKIRCLNIVYVCEDAYRLETLQQGDWHYIGIIAKAEVQLGSNGIIQTLRSGGLWGIESDCEDYHKEVEKEQLAELSKELEAVGFGERAIQYALKNVVRPN